MVDHSNRVVFADSILNEFLVGSTKVEKMKKVSILSRPKNPWFIQQSNTQIYGKMSRLQLEKILNYSVRYQEAEPGKVFILFFVTEKRTNCPKLIPCLINLDPGHLPTFNFLFHCKDLPEGNSQDVVIYLGNIGVGDHRVPL